MVTTCVVCNVTNPGMISIFEHPSNLDYMLNFVTEHKVEGDDFLCLTCYEELKIAFNFKQKCQRSPLYRRVPKYAVEAFRSEVASSLDDFSAPFFEISKSPRTRLKYELQHEGNEEMISTKIPDEDNEETSKDYLFDDQKFIEYKDELAETNKDQQSTDVGKRMMKSTTPSDENEGNFDDPMAGRPDDQAEIKCDLRDKAFTKKGNFHRHRAQAHSSRGKNKRRHRNKHRRHAILKYADNDIYKNLGEGQCEYCFVILATVELLQEHKSQHKEEERPYSCNQPNCTARFKNRHSVRSHVRVHSDQKRCKCRFCSKGFHKRGNLRAHERCHTGEKPFLCPQGNLKSHIRFNTCEPPYSCDYCSKKFRTHFSHKIHLQSHTQE
ncbi:unnamed protein product [Hermetia illucens]|uniref:C2H2-type domain-containing protein n=1 Tax=Hermetia illucens TaxID=343691 RepID=A0A7R8Z1J9_HERIL|nr:zinc finger protein 177-like [Hermetia illucens]CAD7093619.1 unnamed protein product [Hermetia illucens]